MLTKKFTGHFFLLGIVFFLAFFIVPTISHASNTTQEKLDVMVQLMSKGYTVTPTQKDKLKTIFEMSNERQESKEALLIYAAQEWDISEVQKHMLGTIYQTKAMSPFSVEMALRDFYHPSAINPISTASQKSDSGKAFNPNYRVVRQENSDGGYIEQSFDSTGNMVRMLSVPGKITPQNPIKFSCTGHVYYNQPSYYHNQSFTLLADVPKECPPPENKNTPVGQYPYLLNSERNLRYGVRGADVADLQKFVNAYTGSILVPDGRWGPLTEAGVKKFQQNFGLVVDGIVGQRTRNQIYLYLDKKLKSESLATSNAQYVEGKMKSIDYPGADFSFKYPDNSEVNIDRPQERNSNEDNDMFISNKSFIPQQSILEFSIRIQERDSDYTCDDFIDAVSERSIVSVVIDKKSGGEQLYIYEATQGSGYQGCVRSDNKDYTIFIQSDYNPELGRAIAESFKL